MTYNSGYSRSNERVDYHQQINHTNDQSVASTRRMLQQLNEADGAATDTMANLDHQRQQLNRIDENMNKIDVEVREAQKNLTALEKFCGLCTCPCRKPSKLKSHSDTNDAYTVAYSKKSSNSHHSRGGHEHEKGDPHFSRVTGDAREDEMEENLDGVSNYLKDLKMKAIAIGDEVDAQNSIMDGINEKMETNRENIKRSNDQAHRVIKNN